MTTVQVIEAAAGAIALSGCIVGWIYTARKTQQDASTKQKRPELPTIFQPDVSFHLISLF